MTHHQSEPTGDDLTLSATPDGISLRGCLTLRQVERFFSLWDRQRSSLPAGPVVLDLSGLTALDTAGALALQRVRRQETPHRILTWQGLSPAMTGILSLVDPEVLDAAPLRAEESRHLPWIESFGEAWLRFSSDFVRSMTFWGELVSALMTAVRRPGDVRWKDVLYYMSRSGADALPIVGLLSFLIGLIMAFLSSFQLKMFGANIYVASLVGIAVVRELGPMMTAIIVAGRSGSAFAAEIGTMRVNEEVDALVTMGFDPITFLAVPKVLAALCVVPVLTLYSMFFGVLGGLIVGLTGLDLTTNAYLQQTLRSIDLFDVGTSLLKSAFFAALIAGTGCQKGFDVSGGAEAVGDATTLAVVSSIFLIIVADSVFAVVLHYVG